MGGRYRAEMVGSRFSALFSYLNGREPTVFHWVDLEGTDADDAWLKAHHSDISQLTHLILFLRNMHLSGEGLATLRELSDVQCLDLTGTPLTDGDVEQLVALNAVQLWIGRTGISDGALAGLASSPNLVSICIDRTQATPQGISGLSKCPRLHDLVLFDADDESLGSITGLQGITSLSVKAGELSAACLPALKQMQGLQALTLYDSEFSESEIGELKRALPRCSVLQLDYEVVESINESSWD